jgi:hypothetical protein
MKLPTAKRSLVRDCWILATEKYDDFNPTSTPGGPFYSLVCAIYEYATGQDAEGPKVGVIGCVKEIIRFAREVNKRHQRLNILEELSLRRKELKPRYHRLNNRPVSMIPELNNPLLISHDKSQITDKGLKPLCPKRANTVLGCSLLFGFIREKWRQSPNN